MRRYDESVDVRCVPGAELRARVGAPARSAALPVPDRSGRGPGVVPGAVGDAGPDGDRGHPVRSGHAGHAGHDGSAGRPGAADAGGFRDGDEAAWEPDELVPDAFVWRGRLYVVRRVLGRWVERRPWWRTVLDDPRPRVGAGTPAARGAARAFPSAGPPAEPVVAEPAAAPGGLTRADLEEAVWRVEAAPGRLAQVGVYDLAGHPGGPWRLRRVSD